jgi:hypothetical protein
LPLGGVPRASRVPLAERAATISIMRLHLVGERSQCASALPRCLVAYLLTTDTLLSSGNQQHATLAPLAKQCTRMDAFIALAQPVAPALTVGAVHTAHPGVPIARSSDRLSSTVV